jgi:hypothetical protein
MKFQPGLAKLRPWVYQLAKNNPDNDLLRRFALVILCDPVLSEGDPGREALKTECAELVREAVDRLR